MIPISLTFLDSTAANPVTGASLALSLFSQFRDPQKTLDNFDFIFNEKNSIALSSSISLPQASSLNIRMLCS